MAASREPSQPFTLEQLLGIMATLRDPAVGCVWDVAQTFASIAPYTIEEAYEVADAVDRGDLDDLRAELGDLLLQVIFHARIAQEAGAFAFPDVVDTLARKLIRRHPHVFAADGTLVEDRAAAGRPGAIATWDEIKAGERAGKASGPPRLLDDIPSALPALSRADKVSRKAVRYGFEWARVADILDKVREELAEVEECLGDATPARVEEEIGDLLFSVVNLARRCEVDPEEALRRGTNKFAKRFDAMAERLRTSSQDLETAGLDAMEAAWQAVKRDEG